MACGGGGSSSSSGASLPQSSLPPVAALAGWTPNDAQLSQYTSYTFTATATDPNIGGSIASFSWNFGDGTTKTTPSSVINGVATGTCVHAFTAAGTPTLSVTATNVAKVTSAAVTRSLTVNAAASPLTATFTAPAAAITISPAIGSSATVTFTVNVANAGTGALAASGFQMDPGDPKATVGAPTDLGSGNWSIPVAYQADTAIGQRTATPTLTVTDSNGVSSAPVTGPVITIRTVSSVDNAPVITMTATPKIPAGPNATWQGVPIDFVATATDPDQDPLTYTWTFGDTGNAGDIAPTQDAAVLHQSHTYNAPGIYTVVFTADDGRGVPNVSVKTITLNLNIQANAAPTLAVAYPSSSLYANVPLTFTASTSDANGDTVALTWDFGDGSAKVTGTNPVTHSFAAAGSDVVTVTADDGKGGVTTWTATLDILTNRPPVAKVTSAAVNLYQNKSYTFTASATDPDTGDTIDHYAWNFGDNTAVQTSAGGATTSVTHTYASTFAGTANVTVQAVDSHGSTGDWAPAVPFTVLATQLPKGAFLNPAGAATYNTELGATGVSLPYIVSMTNPNGTGYLPISALTFTTGDATAVVQSATANGDGTYTYVVLYKPATVVGTRTVTPTVVATDAQGITGLVASGGPVTINTQAANIPPVISFTSTSTPSAGTNSSWQGVPFTFNGTATDANKDPMTYTITFGDTGGAGDIATTPVPASGAISATHTYAAAGIYTAKLTVSDGRTNGTKTITLNMNILANAAPVVSFTNTPTGTSPYANVPITFTGTVTDANGDPTTITWDFGDGTAKVTGTNPVTHSFAAAGTTVVKLTADDGKGGVTTATQTYTLQANLPPVAKVTTATGSLYQNKSYTFTGSATDPNAGDTIDHYVWNFGDNTAVQTSAGGATTSVTHTYASTFAGTANVTVQAVDSHGSTGDWAPAVPFTVVATPLPVVAFTSPAATTLNAELNGTVTQVFTLTATNPRAGQPGVTDPIPVGDITFNPNDANAAVTNAVSTGGGSYSFTVTYTGAATAGTRTSTPTAYATDTVGIQGLPGTGPLMTITTKGANHAPTITITAPAATTTSAYTSKMVTLTFTLTDQDNDPVSYTVNWGGPDAPPCQPVSVTGTSTQPTQAGVSVTLTHIYPDSFSGTATVTVNATDNRSTNANAVAQSRTIQVALNTPPTASITSPQASGTLMDPATIQSTGQGVPVITQDPTTGAWVADPNGPGVVVIPAGGKLMFSGTGTAPSSGGSLTYAWTFPQGVPANATTQNPGVVKYDGVPGQIVAYKVDLAVTDATDAQDSTCTTVGRTSAVVPTSTEKWVIVDGINTENFNLNLLYRQIQDSTGGSTLAYVTTAANGLGAPIQIFQDGVTYGYNVQDAQGINAAILVPVRSNMPFWLDVPKFGSDGNAYYMRIPNAPAATGDPNGDRTLENGDPLPKNISGKWPFPFLVNTADPNAQVSMFGFEFPAASSGPWNPTLNLVTAQGYAAETTKPLSRMLQGTISATSPSPFATGTSTDLWLDKLAEPASSALLDKGAFTTNPFPISAVPAYQLFAEWVAALETPAAGQASLDQFALSESSQTVSGAVTKTVAPSALRAFRVPAGSTDPYDMDAAGWSSASCNTALNPTNVDPTVAAFYKAMVTNDVSSGGLQNLSIPYDPNDPDRVVKAPTLRSFTGAPAAFSFADYLWTSVWAHPLVLNASALASITPLDLPFSYFYSNVTTGWPQDTVGITPDKSTFDLTPSGGTDFNPSNPPVGTQGTTIVTTGVGRFYWTDYTPQYNANPGANIARTWLAQPASGTTLPMQPPTTSTPLVSTTYNQVLATASLGFVPPQDTVVDKRARDANGKLTGPTTGGYRVTWFNPTQDITPKVVDPDFWVVQLVTTAGTSQFLLPGSFPDPTNYPTYTYNGTKYPDPEAMPILTDATTTMMRLSDRTAANGVEVVAPGYCWFDVPPELRPAPGTTATLTVFALKAVPRTAVGRPLNRTEWIEAIKTATARVSVDAGGGDLSPIYRIPFNYAWDIVITNGPQTPVAP